MTKPPTKPAALSPMKVSGIQNLVERAYRESGYNQHVREATRNSMEAGATRIEIGPEWQAVENLQVYRLMIADDGKGMSAEEILGFLNTFGGGSVAPSISWSTRRPRAASSPRPAR
ncbi:MAG: hypothetical protein JJ863_38560 [Deltaproteobacteria bacterium]|nr:hypothetical protein [Deltaproteobacteria bacterium]